MIDHDEILDALTALRDAGLCTDRRQLNRAWRELTQPTFEQGELTGPT